MGQFLLLKSVRKGTKFIDAKCAFEGFRLMRTMNYIGRIINWSMWTCPNCRHRFFNQNQSHSCGHFSVEDFLENQSSSAILLFRHFLHAYKEIGDYELHPVKTRVALLTQIRFAAINKLGKNYLDGHLVLTSSQKDEGIFYKIDNLNDRFFVHHFRIYEKKEIGKRFIKYMRMAYRVGNREHIKKTVPKRKNPGIRP